VTAVVPDKVLEGEQAQRFASETDAMVRCRGYPDDVAPQSTTARLSRAALQYAQSLDESDASVVARRLYSYNSRPLSPWWARKLYSPEAVMEYLQMTMGAAGVLLQRYWHQTVPTSDAHGWRFFVPRDAGGDGSTDHGPEYKLYVSPDCVAMPWAFPATVATLARVGAPPFKVGRDVYGMLRPDKLVIYVRGYDELCETAERLRCALDGIAVHGVPFTAEIAGDGLLSWGIDPPWGFIETHDGTQASWREWVATRLAHHLSLAKLSTAGSVESWRLAADRVRALGVDINTWAPSAEIWPTGAKSK
jgi:hypothetical protein